MCETCIHKDVIERNRMNIEGNGKPGIKGDVAVIKMTNKLILALNSITLGAIIKLLFFGAK